MLTPSTTTVCPALFPPWKRTTWRKRGLSRSTTLPLPSSPHCRPRIARLVLARLMGPPSPPVYRRICAVERGGGRRYPDRSTRNHPGFGVIFQPGRVSRVRKIHRKSPARHVLCPLRGESVRRGKHPCLLY